METGIYIPNNPDNPMGGGAAIYPRRKNNDGLMEEYLGLSRQSAEMKIRNDIRLLDVIDHVPSIDPFLLKTRFETLGMQIPDGCIRISDSEEKATRGLIEDSLGPIIIKAFEKTGGITPERMKRAIDVIWNPRQPDAALFMKAFGFRLTEAPEMFFALQGVTFYRHLFGLVGGQLQAVRDWMNGPATAPEDMGRHPDYNVKRHKALVAEVAAKIFGYIKEITQVFTAFDLAIQAFRDGDDPSVLRMFLSVIHSHFWRIGHALTSLINASILVEDLLMVPGQMGKFQKVSQTLGQMRIVLSETSEGYRTQL